MNQSTCAASCVAALLLSACASHIDRAQIAAREHAAFRPDDVPGTAAATALEPADTLPEHPSLDDYVRTALWRNAALRAAFANWRAAVEQAPQAASLPDPRVTFAHFIEPIETRTGPQQNRVGISQALPWPGKLDARAESAARRAEALWFDVETQRRTLRRQVSHAFFEYARLARDIGLVSDGQSLLRQLEPVVQRRVQTGAPQAELLQLQVEIGKIEDQLKGLQHYRPALSARLQALLHESQTDVLPWPDLDVPEAPAAPDEPTLRERLASNPELTALQERVAAAVAQVDAAELETIPDLTVGVDWFDTGESRTPNVPGSGTDPWSLTFGMNIPLYRGRYDAMIAEAEHAQEAANQSYHARADQLHADFRMALYRLDDAARQIVLYRDELLPRAQQALELTSTAYGGGAATLLDVIDRERALIAFQESFWRAAAEWGKARADLEALCGPDAFAGARNAEHTETEGDER